MSHQIVLFLRNDNDVHIATFCVNDLYYTKKYVKLSKKAFVKKLCESFSCKPYKFLLINARMYDLKLIVTKVI